MDCPFCGAEMKAGFMQSARGIFWTNKSKFFKIAPNTKSGDVAVTSFRRNGVTEAYLCRTCGKIIADIVRD